MKRAPRSLQHHVLYRKYNGQDSEISALLGKCGFNTNVTLVKGIDVRFNVQNLFDKDPPLIGNDTTYGIGQYFNTFPTYYTVRGRTLRVGISARF